MKKFARLFAAIDETTATNEKVAALVAYFSSAPPGDAAWAVHFLSGRRPKRLVGSRKSGAGGRDHRRRSELAGSATARASAETRLRAVPPRMAVGWTRDDNRISIGRRDGIRAAIERVAHCGQGSELRLSLQRDQAMESFSERERDECLDPASLPPAYC